MRNSYTSIDSTSVTLQPSDYTSKQAYRNQLAKSHLNLVARLAKYFYNKYGNSYRMSKDDFESAGLQALAEALDSFNPAMGKPFGAYAKTAIYNAMHNELHRLLPVDPKTAWGNGKDFSYGKLFDVSVFNSDNPEFSLSILDEIYNNLNSWDEEEQELLEKLNAALGRLSLGDLNLIRAYYGYDGKPTTLQQLGERYNVSPQAVAKKKERILKQLRAYIDSDCGYRMCA